MDGFFERKMAYPDFPHMTKNTVLFCLAILPAIFIAILIFNYSVNLIYWDDWESVGILKKALQEKFCLSDMLSRQVESRIFFPRLITMSIALGTHWDVRYEIAFSFLLLCITSFNIYYMMKSTMGGPRERIFLMFLTANLLLFSPIQSHNLFTGYQMSVFMPVACITSCLAVACSKRSVMPEKFLICAALCTISTFSMISGMISWLVVFPVLFARRDDKAGSRNLFAIGWAAFFLLNAAVYFHDWKKMAGATAGDLSAAFTHPLEAMRYFFALMAGSVCPAYPAIAAAGFIVISLWAAFAALSLIRSVRDSALSNRVAGWVMLGLYAVFSGVLITIGRLSLSINDPAPPIRYATYSGYLIISLAALILIFSDGMWSGGVKKRRTSYAFSLLAVIFFFLLARSFVIGVGEIRRERSLRLKGKAALAFIKILPDGPTLGKRVYPSVDRLADLANFADGLGFINPPLIRSNRIGDIEDGAGQAGDCGDFSNLTKVGDGRYVAAGWSLLPARGEAADLIVLAYEDGRDGPVIFKSTYFTTGIIKGQDKFPNIWAAPFSKSELPDEAVSISAWAYDAITGKAYRLSKSHKI